MEEHQLFALIHRLLERCRDPKRLRIWCCHSWHLGSLSLLNALVLKSGGAKYVSRCVGSGDLLPRITTIFNADQRHQKKGHRLCFSDELWHETDRSYAGAGRILYRLLHGFDRGSQTNNLVLNPDKYGAKMLASWWPTVIFKWLIPSHNPSQVDVPLSRGDLNLSAADYTVQNEMAKVPYSEGEQSCGSWLMLYARQQSLHMRHIAISCLQIDSNKDEA